MQDSIWRATFFKWIQTCSHAKKFYIYITGAQVNIQLKLWAKILLDCQSSFYRNLIILKSVHNTHIWHNRTQLFISSKSEHTDAFLTWTPGIYLTIWFTVCKENTHALCSQDIRYWFQIWFEGIKWQLQVTSHNHCNFLPFLIHPLICDCYQLAGNIFTGRGKQTNWKQG